MAKPIRDDPAKRAAKAARRKLRRQLAASGLQMMPRQKRVSAQMDHGSCPKGVRQAREGEQAMHRERGQQ